LRKVSAAGPTAAEAYQNVQVLGDLSKPEFARLMVSFKNWLGAEEGCNYCHNAPDFASDEKYTKVVARRMIQMTRHINSDWKQHVANTGVTCWTCHRGQAVPSGDWFKVSPDQDSGLPASLGNRAGQNTPGGYVAGSALPSDPMSEFLKAESEVRVQGTAALAGANRHSVKQTEFTYALMTYMSKSLGVNCTYCHNTRAFGVWSESMPQRATAWYGLRLVRDLNASYLMPLESTLPAYRMGPLGDGPKVGCATCHKGTFKPLNGVSMLPDFPELIGPKHPALDSAPVGPIAATPVALKSR
jgi:photosynthetic reaction center cytochrome c subunit